MFKQLVPLVGLIVLAGPVLAVAAPTSSTSTPTATQTKKTHHKHSHHKKTSKPTQAKT